MDYKDHILISYILNARREVTAQDILQHLHHTLPGFTQKQGKDGGLRNVQNQLKAIRECEHFSGIIQATPDGNSFLYKPLTSSKKYPEKMQIEQACALLISDKHLSALAPTRLFQNQGEYQQLIVRAQATVEKYQQQKLQRQSNMNDFLKRICVVPRGQRLLDAVSDDSILQCIAQSIVKQRCINITYKHRNRVLHPFGLVFRQPKTYLLALDDQNLQEWRSAHAPPRQFLCNRIQSASISRKAHQVPEYFNVTDYVNQGFVDVPAYNEAPPESDNNSFSLILKIWGDEDDNFIRDLDEYRLSAKQQLTLVPDKGYYLLEAPDMRATQALVEWVLGRMERVEVVEPSHFRNYIRQKTEQILQRYVD